MRKPATIGGGARTVNSPTSRRKRASGRDHLPALTIVYHPDFARIGERLMFPSGRQSTLKLSRLAPGFAAPGDANARPLEERHVSREALQVTMTAHGTLRLQPPASRMSVLLNGVPLGDGAELSAGALERGVLLELGGYVALYLHLSSPQQDVGSNLGIVGHSDAIASLRDEIRRVALRDVPVLILGESGSGKELVAGAIHRLSGRSQQPLVAVNMAAIQSSTAAAALFGHAKGAFTGAVAAAPGYFLCADGGTLFLDEVGDTPASVQAALLRVLGNGEIQPLGVAKPTTVDVRVVAATDADMTRQVADGRFRPQLLMRLGGYELAVPALRQRREDIGLLLVHFLREFLIKEGREHLLRARGRERPWLPMWVFSEANQHSWPGNVRELRNAAQRIVIACSDSHVVDSHPALERLFKTTLSEPAASAGHRPAARGGRRCLDDIGEVAVREALVTHDFRVGRAAKALGISRTSFYEVCRRYPAIRIAGELDVVEIQQVLAQVNGDVAAAARRLEVSKRALSLRMNTLGVGRS